MLNAPDRSLSDSIKWRRYAGRDILPMWVADMDFASPPEVLAALHGRAEHGVFGYGDATAGVVEAVTTALARDYDWVVDPAWLVWLPGLVTGLNIACRAVGEAGDGVLTGAPIYPPFFSAPHNAQREAVRCDMVRQDGRWQWDFAALEAAITPRTRLFLLCNPANPVGRAFSREELARLADIAERHDLIICSDEIHCGLVLDERLRHLPMASLGPAIAERCITLMAPSKTWNVPGLGCAFAIISDAKLRRRFHQAMAGIVPHVNVLGFTACEAAYRHGEPWRQELLALLRRNAETVFQRINALPGLCATAVEATYLAWIDCRELMTRQDIANPQHFFEHAGVGLSDGRDFGAEGFVRLNFGCSAELLDQALQRMEAAITATYLNAPAVLTPAETSPAE